MTAPRFPVATSNIALYLRDNLRPEYDAVQMKRAELVEELGRTDAYLLYLASVAGAAGIGLEGTDERDETSGGDGIPRR